MPLSFQACPATVPDARNLPFRPANPYQGRQNASSRAGLASDSVSVILAFLLVILTELVNFVIRYLLSVTIPVSVKRP